VFERDGMLLRRHALHRAPDAERGDPSSRRRCAFRTVGDAHLHRRVESDAATIDEVIDEVSASRVTERGATRATTASPRPPWKTASARGTSDDHARDRFAARCPCSARHRRGQRRRRQNPRSSAACCSTPRRIFEDQLAAVERPRASRGFDRTDLALLTDGLRAEREQGITIDVAYRYFATPKRKFIIADTPGTCSTRATWSPARPPPTWPRARRRPQRRGRAVPPARRALDAARVRTSSCASTRWTSSATTRASSTRGYAGRVEGGTFEVGQEVVVLPSGMRSTVAGIDTLDGSHESATVSQSVVLRLTDDVDVSRGDLIADVESSPEVTRELTATVCWMTTGALHSRQKLLLKHTTRTVRTIVDGVNAKVDINTLDRDGGAEELGLNEIGTVSLRLSQPLVVDPYRAQRVTGSFILIDPATGGTVGAGMIDATHGVEYSI
jgi:hypothetical protein